MQSVGRGVKHEMKFVGHGANSLQGAAQTAHQDRAQAARTAEAEALESGIMSARKDPGFVGHARRIRTKRNEVAAHFEHPLVLLQLLGNNVAEDAAFFRFEVVLPARNS